MSGITTAGTEPAELPEPGHQERQAVLLLRRYLAMPPGVQRAALRLLSNEEAVQLEAATSRPWWSW